MISTPKSHTHRMFNLIEWMFLLIPATALLAVWAVIKSLSIPVGITQYTLQTSLKVNQYLMQTLLSIGPKR